MGRLLLVVYTVCVSLTFACEVSAQTAASLVLPARVAVQSVADERFHRLLSDLDRELGLRPVDDTALMDADASPSIVVLELRRSSEPSNQVFLYYQPATSQVYFLKFRRDREHGDVRFWGLGPSKIVINADGIQLFEQPPAFPFRLTRNATARLELADLGLWDSVRCLAQMLGIPLSLGALRDLFAELVCPAGRRWRDITDDIKARWKRIDTAVACVSGLLSIGAANVISTGACVANFALMIGCGIAALRRFEYSRLS